MKKMLPYISLVFAGFMQALGSALLKYSNIYKSSLDSKTYICVAIVFAGMTCYGVIFPITAYALSKVKLTIYQPLLTSAVYIFTYIMAVGIFNEPIGIKQLTGIILVVLGVFIVVSTGAKYKKKHEAENNPALS